jgi:erythronate-4-phosphate dehydrogenase
MNIYFDENMPYAEQFFAGFGKLVPFAGRTLSAEQLQDADVLLVRSITQVNKALLARAKRLKFVGTATIGVDHIDQAYLHERGIAFSAAPGCNATSVAEYVLSALVVLGERQQRDLSRLTVGIVGAGNTGSRLAQKLAALGINYQLCDPLLARTGTDQREFVDLEQILTADVISLHVPLTHPHHQQQDATFHLLDQSKLSQLTSTQILINACRGEVVDNKALLKLKQQGLGPTLVLDVWEQEPHILLPLLQYTEIATAHIAGYSLEGKARGTEQLYQALCCLLKVPVVHALAQFLPVATISQVTLSEPFNDIVRDQLIKLVYDIRRDDALFRQQIASQGFDYLRKTYPARREFSCLSITSTQSANADVPYQIGFSKANLCL